MGGNRTWSRLLSLTAFYFPLQIAWFRGSKVGNLKWKIFFGRLGAKSKKGVCFCLFLVLRKQQQQQEQHGPSLSAFLRFFLFFYYFFNNYDYARYQD
jgi:hypothetical protein